MAFDFSFTVPAGRKLGNVAAKDSTRYALNSVAFIPSELRLPSDGPTGEKFDGGHLVATDGKILAVLPVDASGEYPGSAVALPCEACNGNGKPLQVAVNGELRMTPVHPKFSSKALSAKTTIAPLPTDCGRYPRVGDVFPSVVNNHKVIKLVIDVDLLSRLAGAIGDSPIVTVYMEAKDGKVCSPLAIVGHTADCAPAAIGVLMPLTSPSEKNPLNPDKPIPDAFLERYNQLSEVIRKTGPIEFKAQQPAPVAS